MNYLKQSPNDFFSKRLPVDFEPNILKRSLSSCRGVLDLTLANPTCLGFIYPKEAIASLAQNNALVYEPSSLGLLSARQALALYLAKQGQPVSAEQLMLTASTSEAYALIFKLLCNAGDTIAVGAPSYPLVAHLAELEGLKPLAYRLTYEGGRWCLDMPSLYQALEMGAKIIVLISPNNPTGSIPTPEELDAIAECCVRYQAALIVDDVFSPYVLGHSINPLDHLLAYQPSVPLLFTLNGLSKAVGLPQHKVGWIAVHGQEPLRSLALERLAWIADAYLSVAGPLQLALPQILQLASDMQRQMRARVAVNRSCLQQMLQDFPSFQLAASQGGWYSAVRVPRLMPDDELILTLLHQAGVLMHPGYFYDFEQEGWLITALLLPPDRFALAWQRSLKVLKPLLT